MSKKANVVKTLAAMKTAGLVEIFETTTTNDDENVPTVRGWVMDALEARCPLAFDLWLDSCEDSPRAYYL